MNRKALYGALAALALAVFAGVWFINHFREVTRQVPDGYSVEARRNTWLAAQRLFTELGLKSKMVSNLAGLDDAPRGLLIVPADRPIWSPAQRDALLRWVAQGGHLLVESRQADARDELLDALGVQRTAIDYMQGRAKRAGGETPAASPDGEVPSQDGKDTPQTEEDDRPEDEPQTVDDAAAPAGQTPAKPLPAMPAAELSIEAVPNARNGTRRIRLPGAAHAFEVQSFGGESLSSREVPAFVVHDQFGVHMLGLKRGQGRVTVINDLSFMGNFLIGHNQHADFLWELAQLPGQPPTQVLLFRAESQRWWAWLIERALPLLMTLGLLLGIWLWRVIPRRGPLRPAAPPARPQWLAHLEASGRFQWQRRDRAALLDALRRACLQDLERIDPEWMHRDGQARVLSLARHLHALDAPYAAGHDDAAVLLGSASTALDHANAAQVLVRIARWRHKARAALARATNPPAP